MHEYNVMYTTGNFRFYCPDEKSAQSLKSTTQTEAERVTELISKVARTPKTKVKLKTSTPRKRKSKLTFSSQRKKQGLFELLTISFL